MLKRLNPKKNGGKKTLMNLKRKFLIRASKKYLQQQSQLLLPLLQKCVAILVVQTPLMPLISAVLPVGSASVKHMVVQALIVLTVHNQVKTLFLWNEPRGVNPDCITI